MCIRQRGQRTVRAVVGQRIEGRFCDFLPCVLDRLALFHLRQFSNLADPVAVLVQRDEPVGAFSVSQQFNCHCQRTQAVTVLFVVPDLLDGRGSQLRFILDGCCHDTHAEIRCKDDFRRFHCAQEYVAGRQAGQDRGPFLAFPEGRRDM